MADTSVTIIGNLTGDPELRFTPSGIAVASMDVAVTPRTRTDAGAWEDGETSFFRVTVWRDYAEHVADSLEKGNRVVVVGTLAIQTWEDPEGNRRSRPEITASEVTPSLRWATARVERIRKESDGDAPRGNGASRRGRQPARSSSSRSSRSPKGRETAPTSGGNFDDNPPF